MRFYAFILILFLSCSASLQSTQPTSQSKSISFDQLNEFEELIEESDVAVEKMKEVKISAGTQRVLQAVSWVYVQGFTLKQKIAGCFSVLFSWFKKKREHEAI